VKQQLLLAVAGAALLLILFFFAPVVSGESKNNTNPPPRALDFNVTGYINTLKKDRLSPSQLAFVMNIENSISRGAVKEQAIRSYQQLAAFWKDSLHLLEPYAFYTAEAAKLENSEKSLTFAARLMLEAVRAERTDSVRMWKAKEAAGLFEKALALNPANDSLKVGLGSTYVFGRGMMGEPAETMKGIQQLLEVVRKDSTNMQAQLVLGIGGFISQQYDKAIPRLLKVVTAEPTNIEAVTWLADAYVATGDKKKAIEWYTYSKKLINNPDFIREVDQRIKEIR
jgi:tetratricopeptide (TPR) repeat protein